MCSLLGYQLGCELLVLLFSSTEGFIILSAKIGLNPSFIPRVLDPFLCHGDLLDSLHMGSKRVSLKKRKKKKRKRKQKRKERESLLIKSAEELTMVKSFFRDKKSFSYLMCFRASMSLGRRRGRSKALATW